MTMERKEQSRRRDQEVEQRRWEGSTVSLVCSIFYEIR